MSNTISFVGTLGKNATVNTLPSGGAVVRCNIANNVGFGDNKKTNWFAVSIFGKRAEGTLVDFLRKGQQVFISGEFTARQYQDNHGEARISLDIVASQIDLIGKNNSASGQSQQNMPTAPPVEAYED